MIISFREASRTVCSADGTLLCFVLFAAKEVCKEAISSIV